MRTLRRLQLLSAPLATLALALGLAGAAGAQTPGTFVDLFDDGVVGPEYSAVGGATLSESGGQLVVAQSAPGDGVLVTFPATVGPDPLYPFCVRWGIDVVQQLADGATLTVRVFDPPPPAFTNPLGSGEKVRWEITKTGDRTYEYKVYKDGQLKVRGRVRIPVGTKGFRIDKKPGTNMIIGEVIMSDGSWEKLWEKDPPPPEEPFSAMSVTSDMDGFALDEVMAGLHTDDPSTEGAVGDLSVVPIDQGGVLFTPLGGDLYDVDVTLDSIATFGGEGEELIEVELRIGDPARSVRAGVTCRGGGTGTCSGRSNCGSKTCPDREYDIGDGNGFQPYTGTCGMPSLGLPVCSCSYRPTRRFSAVQILPNEAVEVVVDPDNLLPEFTEGDNTVTTRPTIEAYAAAETYSCTTAGTVPTEPGLAEDVADADAVGITLDTTLRLASGYLDVDAIDSSTVELFLSTDQGVDDKPIALSDMWVVNGVAHLTFRTSPADGHLVCPNELLLVGAAPPQFFSAITAARVTDDAEVYTTTRALLEQLAGYPPELEGLGTARIGANPVTGQIIAMGDLALPALHDAVGENDRLIQAYSAYCLGEIGNTLSILPLADAEAVLEAQPDKQGLDFTALGEIRYALDLLQGGGGNKPGGGGNQGNPGEETPEKPVPGEEEKRCCVTDAEIVSSGPLQGGKKMGDYYPDLANPDGTSSRWNGDGSQAGEFSGTRTGVAVQLIGTMEGDRDCCTMTQTFVLEESNYPGPEVGAIGAQVDDIAKSGRDPSGPPFRQNIGTNQISMADPPNAPYNAGSNFHRKMRYETCFHSYPDSDPPCEWEKCCVVWVFEQTVTNGSPSSTVTEVGSYCE